jgi:hypothetical protein
VLHHFQQPRQGRGYARTDTCKQYRKPEAGRARMGQCGRYHVAVAPSRIYRNTGANDIDIKPSIKRMNITVSKCFTSRVAPRNSFHTKTPQAAEIIVLPSPSENEVAGPTMGV